MSRTIVLRMAISILMLAILLSITGCITINISPTESAKEATTASPTKAETAAASSAAATTAQPSLSESAETTEPKPEPARLLYVNSIGGNLIVGGLLEAGLLLYSEELFEEPELTWQWLRSPTLDGTYTEIPGATDRTYRATTADLDQYINISVIATGSATGAAISDPVKIGQLVLAPFKPIGGYYPIRTDGTSDSPFSGGSGTKDDPYKISTADQFALLDSNTADTYFLLVNDINFTAKGTITGTFYGHLDGGQHLVTIRSHTGYGLFNEIASGASLTDLRVSGTNKPVVGSNLKSCSRGNLANYNYGTIRRCSVEDFDAEIYNAVKLCFGGMIGKNFGLVEECFASGNFLLNLVKCEAINGYYPSLADDLLSDWNKGWGGGLVSINMAGGVIKNCYSLMNVAVDSPGELTYGISGGLVAVNEGTIFFCYSAGAVSNNKWCGGLAGTNHAASGIQNSYYDQRTSNKTDDKGKGIPCSTEEMKTQSTFVGWSTDIWSFSNDRSRYPALHWQ